MINALEKDEKKYLEDVKDKLKDNLEKINDKVRAYAKEIKDQKTYLWENKSGMDHVEKIAVRQSVDQSIFIGEAVLDKSKRIKKLLVAPYFGRFDFREEKQEQEIPIYIGVHAFFDEETNESLIHDWRAPISTMFYDYETGVARYESLKGEVSGEITLKRQYCIRNEEIRMYESYA